ncbi:hypothetical protein, partial [Endozoicomonas sp. SESOKO2]
MDPANNTFSMDGSLSPSINRARLGGESSGVSAGRSIAIPDKEEKKKLLFFDLPIETTHKIIGLLEVRDVV